MADSKQADPDNKGKADQGKIIHFTELNFLGKAVFLGGVLTRVATKVVDSTIRATADIVTEAEKAFKQGLDPNVEEAKIIEEHEESSKSKS